MKIRKKLLKFFSAGLSLLATQQASSYDNSKFPAFEIEVPHREFEFISIHPNDEDWLITEAAGNGILLLYNKKTRHLQRYSIPGNHQYIFGTFSPSGRKIVMIRRWETASRSMVDQLQELRNSEIAVMNKDGTGFRILPASKGIIIAVAMSSDEKKIAYWVAKTIRNPGSKSLITDFDIRELDLTTKEERLFAGPFEFFEIGSISYLNDSTLLIGAFAPKGINLTIQEYAKKFNYSQIYQIHRGQKELPLPIFYKNKSARSPVIDNQKNIYLIDYPDNTGRALTRISRDGNYSSWRAPDIKTQNLHRLAVSPKGQYVAFIYGNHRSAIGVFELDREAWLPIALPPTNEASLITIKPAV
jgi:hypothetical protein